MERKQPDWSVDRRRLLSLILVIAVVVVVMIVALSLFRNGHPTTPDGVYLEFIDRFNDRDVEGAIDLTLMSFANEDKRQDYTDVLWSFVMRVDIHHYSVVTRENMTGLQLNRSIKYIDLYVHNTTEPDFYTEELVVEDFCIIHCTATEHFASGNKNDSTLDALVLKIQGRWYGGSYLGDYLDEP